MLARDLVFNETRSTRLVVAAILIALTVLAMETVLAVPLKLPGHRALPGAIALLVFAEAFAPLLVLGLAATISAVLVLGQAASPLIFAVWVVAALVVVALQRTRLAHTVFFFLAGGLVFGLLRYLAMAKGLHHTPDLIRLAGHLAFGGLGGAVSFGLVRGLAPTGGKDGAHH